VTYQKYERTEFIYVDENNIIKNKYQIKNKLSKFKKNSGSKEIMIAVFIVQVY